MEFNSWEILSLFEFQLSLSFFQNLLLLHPNSFLGQIYYGTFCGSQEHLGQIWEFFWAGSVLDEFLKLIFFSGSFPVFRQRLQLDLPRSISPSSDVLFEWIQRHKFDLWVLKTTKKTMHKKLLRIRRNRISCELLQFWRKFSADWCSWCSWFFSPTLIGFSW